MRSKWRLSAAAVAGVMCVLLLVGAVGAPVASGAREIHRQTTPSTTGPPSGSSPTPTTTEDVLQGTPTSAASTTTPKTSSSPRVADDNRKIWLVVAALLLVAVLLGLLTMWYWNHTRPSDANEAVGRPRPPRPRRPASEGPGDRSGQPSDAPYDSDLDFDDLGDPPREDEAPRSRRAGQPAERPSARRPLRPDRASRDAALRRARDLSR